MAEPTRDEKYKMLMAEAGYQIEMSDHRPSAHYVGSATAGPYQITISHLQADYRAHTIIEDYNPFADFDGYLAWFKDRNPKWTVLDG